MLAPAPLLVSPIGQAGDQFAAGQSQVRAALDTDQIGAHQFPQAGVGVFPVGGVDGLAEEDLGIGEHGVQHAKTGGIEPVGEPLAEDDERQRREEGGVGIGDLPVLLFPPPLPLITAAGHLTVTHGGEDGVDRDLAQHPVNTGGQQPVGLLAQDMGTVAPLPHRDGAIEGGAVGIRQGCRWQERDGQAKAEQTGQNSRRDKVPGPGCSRNAHAHGEPPS